MALKAPQVRPTNGWPPPLRPLTLREWPLLYAIGCRLRITSGRRGFEVYLDPGVKLYANPIDVARYMAQGLLREEPKDHPYPYSLTELGWSEVQKAILATDPKSLTPDAADVKSEPK